MHRIIFSSLFFLPTAVSAGITLYTDSQHPPVNPPSDVRVILLDGPEQLQARFFGALPADAGEAEERVRARMQSPEWGRCRRSWLSVTGRWRMHGHWA